MAELPHHVAKWDLCTDGTITLTGGCGIWPRRGPFMRHSYRRWGSHSTPESRAGYSLKQPERTVRLSFLASRSRHDMSPTNAGSRSGRTVRARSTVSVLSRKEVNSHCVHQTFPHSFTDWINRCLRELVGEAQSGHLAGWLFGSTGLVSATLWTWCARVTRMLPLQPLQ
jgi:hypothetical protein